MEPMVRLEVVDGVATATLNRPEARNAMSPELIEAVDQTLAMVEADRSLRVLVLAGAGKAFCAGMDLKAVRSDPAAMGQMLRRLAAVMRRLRLLSIPTIARVHGAAIGGGCGLMVVCDFAVTHPEAKVGYPEVDLGICPAVVAPWLVQRIGAGRARAMLLAGGTMSGADGHAAGLATHLAEQSRLDETVAALARRLSAGGPKALAATKRWLNHLDGADREELYARGAEISAEIIAGEEAQSRLAAMWGS